MFEFLSDEGLLPNYAFPETGVVLKSVVFRRRETPSESGSNFDNFVYEYERPAVAAISELAPDNYFYAEGRRVQIDKVNLTVSSVETWRLCRSCSYSELQGSREETSACRRCGDTLWADSGQKREMLRMRQVYATTSDRNSRIGDHTDSREPKFYNRQMLVDFERTDIARAYRLNSDLPFGFEFLAKVRLHEINFGEKADSGPSVTVAGVELPRRGFVLCRHCGKVQRGDPGNSGFGKAGSKTVARTGGKDADGPRHDFTCTANQPDAPKTFTHCVYLYRELSSEAIRILLPIDTFAGSDRKLHSFVAALHLGLKKRFQGNIDHLQTTVYDEPEAGTNHRRRYLVLYDTVPGGTGYLKQLMLNEHELLAVFDRALSSLTACPCRLDSSKDGCYLCLFAYRRSYDMKETSRQAAIDLLGAILKHRGAFEPTDTISTIAINSLFDSELEARLVEALARARRDDLPVSLKKEVVNGKSGYFLRIAERAYTIEPQVGIGQDLGVAIPSKVDFLFRPVGLKGAPGGQVGNARPIALFTDGLVWHKTRIGKDMAQRMALVHSGRYRVWSLTWRDVDSSFKHQGSYFTDPLQVGEASFGQYAAHYQADSLRDANRENSFEWLVRYLAAPEAMEAERAWQAYAFVHGLLLLHGNRSTTASTDADWRAGVSGHLEPRLAATLLVDDGKTQRGAVHDVTFDGGPELHLYVALTEAAIQAGDPGGMRLASHLGDRPGARDAREFERIWTGYLRLFNLFQFLPQAWFVTGTGLATSAYDALEIGPREPDASPTTDLDLAWQDVWTEVASEMHPLLKALIHAGWPAPAIPTFELTSADGETLAEAELAWPDAHLAFLSDAQLTHGQHFTAAGFGVVELTTAIADPAAQLHRHPQRHPNGGSP